MVARYAAGQRRWSVVGNDLRPAVVVLDRVHALGARRATRMGLHQQHARGGKHPLQLRAPAAGSADLYTDDELLLVDLDNHVDRNTYHGSRKAHLHGAVAGPMPVDPRLLRRQRRPRIWSLSFLGENSGSGRQPRHG